MHALVAILLAFACALAPAAVVAEGAPGDQPEPVAAPAQPAASNESSIDTVYDDYFMSDEHRQKIYDKNRKRPEKAVLYTALFPGLGNIYAEQYLLAGLAIVLMVFAGTFVGYGLSTKQGNIVILGGITAGVAYGGGAVTSMLGVSNYNRKLREGLKVGQSDVRQVWTPTLVLRF